MRLEPLYTVRFTYPEGWEIPLSGADGTEQHHFYFPEGRCEGAIVGRFRGANHPRRRTDGAFAMDLQGFIATDDGATIMVDYQGYGRSRARSDALYGEAGLPEERTRHRRQVVGFARHVTDDPRYRDLNDTVCAVAGEVRAPVGVPPAQIQQADVRLVFSVAKLLWEPPPE